MSVYDDWKKQNPTANDKQTANVEFVLKSIDAAKPSPTSSGGAIFPRTAATTTAQALAIPGAKAGDYLLNAFTAGLSLCGAFIQPGEIVRIPASGNAAVTDIGSIESLRGQLFKSPAYVGGNNPHNLPLGLYMINIYEGAWQPSGASYDNIMILSQTDTGQGALWIDFSSGRMWTWSGSWNISMPDSDRRNKWKPVGNTTTYNNATISAAGLMSSADKIKLNGINTVNTALSSNFVIGSVVNGNLPTGVYQAHPNDFACLGGSIGGRSPALGEQVSVFIVTASQPMQVHPSSGVLSSCRFIRFPLYATGV